MNNTEVLSIKVEIAKLILSNGLIIDNNILSLQNNLYNNEDLFNQIICELLSDGYIVNLDDILFLLTPKGYELINLDGKFYEYFKKITKLVLNQRDLFNNLFHCFIKQYYLTNEINSKKYEYLTLPNKYSELFKFIPESRIVYIKETVRDYSSCVLYLVLDDNIDDEHMFEICNIFKSIINDGEHSILLLSDNDSIIDFKSCCVSLGIKQNVNYKIYLIPDIKNDGQDLINYFTENYNVSDPLIEINAEKLNIRNVNYKVSNFKAFINRSNLSSSKIAAVMNVTNKELTKILSAKKISSIFIKEFQNTFNLPTSFVKDLNKKDFDFKKYISLLDEESSFTGSKSIQRNENIDDTSNLFHEAKSVTININDNEDSNILMSNIKNMRLPDEVLNHVSNNLKNLLDEQSDKCLNILTSFYNKSREEIIGEAIVNLFKSEDILNKALKLYMQNIYMKEAIDLMNNQGN